MKKFTYPIVVFAMILALPPLLLVAMQWHWQPFDNPFGLPLLYITNTAGKPWSIITSLLLLLLTLWLIRPRGKQWIKWVIVMTGCIVIAQGLKVGIKNSVQTPRPYVLWLEQQYNISPNQFYAQDRQQRKVLIKQLTSNVSDIPQWQLTHWQNETGYSFPSGHTLFAAGWALLLIGLFWQRGYYLWSIALAVWAESVIVSRLVLAMHWPSDILLSIAINAVLAVIACRLLAQPTNR
ncbi:phosphatase PAP2 family protein [Moellerella wisconsensis]|uniref:phosphatase PAP2 family protein n=1 Tax=Moellerella wisconsensis TaxID=158849 RepID=UPI0025B08A79|nr:phosphatase PAP2 family protein [Moellerella wisconsensis]WJW80596.1 phosphatase PAP2 family protein [Moellerella wisconsensis]